MMIKIILYIVLLKGVVSGQVLLSPSSPGVTENNSLTLTCTYSGNKDVVTFTWKRVQANASVYANLGLINPECNALIIPVDNSSYQYSCPSSKQYTWTIKKVTRQNEGDKYQCDVETTPFPGIINSNEVIISIQVPITSIEVVTPINSIITVKENTETEFKCKTSGGLPEANVTWYKNEGTSNQQGNEVAINSLITSSSVTVNGLKEVTSILKYSPSRNENGWRIYCKARNVVDQALIVSTRKPQLNVQYAPDSLEIKGFVDGGEYRVIEKSQGQLSCTITGGNPKPTLLWDCYNSGTNIASNEGIVTRNQTWNAEREKDKTCFCRSVHYSGNRSVSIYIKILYPPNEPNFQIQGTSVSGTIKVIRNNTLSVSCHSSANPPPSYTWTYSNNVRRSGQVLSIKNVQSNSIYTCLVQNTMNPTDGQEVTRRNSSYIDVKMLSAPSIPTFNYWNTSGQSIPTRSLDVIKDDTFKVACTSNGEPSPTYYWDNLGDNRILTITRIDTDKTSVCKATNTMKETVGQTSTKSATASLTINVQYPPSAVTLQYGKGDILTTALKVREGTPFNITCSSRSNPPPSYNWTGTVSSTSAVLNVNKALKTHTGTIICNIANVMIRTFANPEKQKTVATNKVLDLHILYPPKIGDLKNLSVVEDSPLNVLCPVTVGNPQQTNYEWLRKGLVWKTTQRFTIDKVNRNDSMFYTCKVTNTMEATGEKPVSSDVTKAFYLNVWYSATVNNFFISGHEGEFKVVKNESDRVEFTCTVDSNPGSYMSVTYTEEVLEKATNVKYLTHVIDSASCTTRGEYKCTGFNQYNQNQAFQIINLYINCSPRPSPFTTLRENVTSAQHIPAVLTFTTLAYPETTLEFKWYTWYNNMRQPVTNSEEFQIETLNLQSNLTIKYVNRTYYGKYELQVKNTVGNYTQFFYLDPEDKPETPRGFQHLSEKLTESSITVQWIPGFDNGPRQTFVLRYKKSSDKVWTDIEIADREEDLMNYTLTSLSSGTQYECVLYARNILGNSSQTNIQRIKTKSVDKKNPGTSLGLIIGAVCGGLACGLLGVLGFFLFRKFRNRAGKERSEVELDGRHMDNEDGDSSDSEVMTENAMYESASNVGQKKLVPDDVYAKPQKKSAQSTDVYAVVNKTKKQGKKKKHKSDPKKTNKDSGDIYENAPPAAIDKDKTYANSAYDENPYEATDQQHTRHKPKRNADGLIYADLTFNDQPKGQKKLVIHGLDSMTEYVEVDFTKKAEPLPDSDTEDQK